MKSCRIFILLSAGFLFIFAGKIFPQLSYKAAAESGIFYSKGNFLLNEYGLLARIDGRIGYTYNNENTTASASLRIKPEFYTNDKKVNSLKLRAAGSYSKSEENFNWGLNISRQLNTFSGTSINIDFDIFSLTASSAFFFIDGFPIAFNAGYAYQSANSADRQDLDLSFAELKLNQIFSTYFRTGYGFYFEKFLVEGRLAGADQNYQKQNSGYRFGPELEIFHLKDFVFNLQYRFLLHYSDITKPGSYEHWIRLVAGKILLPRFSAFILADYYSRNFKAETSLNDKLFILYSPLDQENHISFKAGYEITESFGIYIKTGYFSQNLVYNEYALKGWSVLLGAEIGN